MALRERRGICAEAEPGAVPKRNEAGVADEDVERHAGDRKDHDVGCARQRETAGEQCERKNDKHRRSDRKTLHRGYSKRRIRSPSSPRGRISSTSTISKYIDASAADGKTYTVSPRTTPTINAAQTTPQNEPKPPITTTTKAAVRTSAPIAGCTPDIGASSTPASAASATLIATTPLMYGASEMPSAATMSGFCTPARTTRPNGVRCSRNHNPATAAAATSNISRRYLE